MIIECPSCSAKYQYDDKRFDGKPSKKIRCARCQEVFEIHNPATAAAHAAPAVAPAAAGDSTFTARPGRTLASRMPEPAESTEQSEIPQPAPQHSETPQMPVGKRLSLAILDGPDAGSVYRIDKPQITIGRANADLTLNDGEASRQHAMLEIRDSTVTLSDLGSTNGTLVAGEKISGAVDLSDKSEFQVGTTTLMLIVTDEG